MEKVKVTPKQASLIQIRIDRGCRGMENMLEHHVVDSWTGAGNECLNALSVSELARALYVGYEVEPELERGQFAIHRQGSIREIVNIYDKYVEVEDNHGGRFVWNKGTFRIATDEEIAREKTRRWWAKHDRQPWEIREGDILNVNDEYLEV